MSQRRRVLMVVTSHDRITEDHPTGLWLEEFALPYTLFREAGLEVTVASPLGGPAPIDPNSHAAPELASAWVEASVRLATTLPLDEMESREFGTLFLPGGHGTMFDFPHNARLRQLLREMDAAGKVVAAVCHGPAALVDVPRIDSDAPLVEGRTLTAFTDAEEREVGLAGAVPFLLESRLRELGASVVTGPNWAEHVQVDRNLVTGQNPQSSAATARAVLDLLAGAAREAA